MLNMIFFMPLVLSVQEGGAGHASRVRGDAKEWTVFVYMAADNNLEDVGVSDFNEMEIVGSGPDLNIVVQFDRIPGHDSTNGNWNDTRRFLVEQDYDPNIITSTPVNDSLGELDMADPNTLKDFLDWGIDAYPANRYMLVMWDHGSGIFRRSNGSDGEGELTRGFCQDWTNGGDLKIWELRSVLNGLKATRGVHFEIIAADVCYFGFIEMAYQIRAHTDYFIGSSDEEPAPGWDYQKVLSLISEKPYTTTRDVAINIVERYLEKYTQNYITIMALDIAWMENDLIPVLERFSKSLISSTYYHHSAIQNAKRNADRPRSDYVDLYSFVRLIRDDISLPLPLSEKATELTKSLETSVIAYGTGSNHPNSLGLGIWFPENFINSYNKNTYLRKLDFSELSWDDFLKEYDSPTQVSIEHTPLGDTEDVDRPYIFEAKINAPVGSISDVLLNYSVDGENFTTKEFSLIEEKYYLELDISVKNSTIYYYIILNLNDNSTKTAPLYADSGILGTLYRFWVGLDVTPPTIIHFPLDNITEIDNSYSVTAAISDNMGIDVKKTYLKYKINSTSPGTDPTVIPMEPVTSNIFQADIPPQRPGTELFYWLETQDISKSINTARLPKEGYFHSTYVLYKRTLLIDRAHGNDLNYTNITQEYLVENFEIEFLTSPADNDNLKDFDLFITTGPATPFTRDEMNYLEGFCRNGSSIFIVDGGDHNISSDIALLGNISFVNSTLPFEGNSTNINRSLEKFDYVDTIYYNHHPYVLEGGDHMVLGSASSEILCAYSNLGRGRIAAITDGILSDGNITKQGNYTTYDNFEFARGLLRLLIDNRKAVAVIDVEESLEAPDVLQVGIPYTFTGLGSYDLDGDIINYTWELNGESIGHGGRITHTFTESGEYDINLHVKDAEETWSHGGKRYISNLPPEPGFEAALNTSESLVLLPDGVDITGGEGIHFKSTSRDIDGVIVAERWDFGDGTEVIENKTEVVHTFNAKGLFNVTLTVWDNNMIARSISAPFNISNAPPVVILEVGNRANEDDAVYMNAHKSYDPNVETKDFFKNVLWDFGDGETQDHSLVASHVYHKKGTYNVTLYITDLDEDDPLTGSAVWAIDIYNLPPEANATYTDKKGATITFSGGASSDTPSDQDTLQYHWDFDDGKKGEGVEIKHHFKKDGTYNVTLIVADDDGSNSTPAVLIVNITSDRTIRINYWAVAAFIGLFILLIVVWVHPRFKKKEKDKKRVGKKSVIKKVKVRKVTATAKKREDTETDEITDEGRDESLLSRTEKNGNPESDVTPNEKIEVEVRS